MLDCGVVGPVHLSQIDEVCLWVPCSDPNDLKLMIGVGEGASVIHLRGQHSWKALPQRRTHSRLISSVSMLARAFSITG